MSEIFWSVFYCLLSVGMDIIIGRSVSIFGIAKRIILGPYHLWFIYLIITIYLLVPLLRLWVKRENKREVKYFVILALIFTFFLSEGIYVGKNYSSVFLSIEKIISERVNMQYVGGFTVYFIFGWYLHNYSIRKYSLLYWLGAISLLVDRKSVV